MKKIVLAVILSLVFISSAFAETGLALIDSLKKLPNFKQGVIYSLADSEFDYATTVKVAHWKDICLELGYSPKTEALAVISYPILKLKDLGVELPILDLVELNLGAYAGLRRIGIGNSRYEGNNEIDYGFSVTIISIGF